MRRILKAFVDGQWLNELDARLEEYAVSLGLAAQAGASDD